MSAAAALLVVRESSDSGRGYGGRPDAEAAGGITTDEAAAERLERVDVPRSGAPHALGPVGSSASASAAFDSAAAFDTADVLDRTAASGAAETSNTPDPYDPHKPPPDDDDALFELEEEIATLSAHIAAATHELLSMIAEFDRRGGWKIGGHRSCAHWLHFRTGVDMGTAREKVRTARALQSLPKTSEEMAKGALSFSQARALTRVATPESEEELLEAARSLTVSDLERFLRSWRVLSRKDEAELERERHRSRGFSVFPDEMGMYEVRGKLPAEVGAVLMRAIEAAGDALFTKESASETTAKQRRADAIGLVAERALAAGFWGSSSEGVSEHTSGTVAGGVSRNVSPEASRPALLEEAGGETAEHAPEHGPGNASHETSESPYETYECPSCAHGQGTEAAPISGSRAERYQVVLHVEAAALVEEEAAATPWQTELAHGGESGRAGQSGRGDESGRDEEPDTGQAPRSHFEDGTRASSETSRRLTCDASVVKMGRGGKGEVLDVGRKTRTVPPSIRRALEVRDGGCTFPGCGLRFAEAHHVKHWADGGETKLDNLILLCRYHHRLLHEEGWSVVYRGATSARGGTSASAAGAEDAASVGPMERPTPPVFFDPHGHARSSARPRRRSAQGTGRFFALGTGRRTAPDPRQRTVPGTGRRTGPETGRLSEPRTAEHAADASEGAEALLSRRNRQRGVDPDGSELAPRYASEREVPLPILERAFEALATRPG